MSVKSGMDVLNLCSRSHAECVCVSAFELFTEFYVFIQLQTKVKIKFFTNNLFSTLAKVS